MTGPGSVLDTAVLSAPSVVEACVRSDRHELDLGGERFLVREVVPEHPGTLRSLYGDLAPIAVLPADGGEMVICPGRDHRVGPGDRVGLLGPATVDGPGPGTEARRRRRPLAAARRTAASLLSEVDRPFRWTVAALVVAALVSMVVIRLGYRPAGGGRIKILDAAYFTVVTDATVGYGDFNFREQAGWLVVFGIVDIIVGATLAAALFAQITNMLVNRRLAQALGRQKVTGMSGHVVVAGLGSVGMQVVQGLQARGTDVVVVERDESNRYLAQARSLGVPVVVADAIRTRVIALSRAGGGLEYPPRRGTRFAAGDQAYLVGPYEELLRVLRQDQQARPG